MKNSVYRIGQIVPSSNSTMETEIPAMLRLREGIRPERFTFHSSRMRMHKVTKEELEKMDHDSLRCAAELADVRVDVIGYACLVAIMSMGLCYHYTSEENLRRVARENHCDVPVVTAAGALVEGLKAMGAKKISIITPYMKPLADMVKKYIENEGFQIIDSIALEIPDNLEVGWRDPMLLVEDVKRLNIDEADVIVLSSCVNLPSLPAIQVVEDKIGKAVTSASICTTYSLLDHLRLEPVVPKAGVLLSERK